MGDTTKIQWCDYTWNPWRGCTKVSEGCKNCYAEKLVTTRLGGQWGKGKPRQRASQKILNDPYRWNRQGLVRSHRGRVFLGSLMDIFDPEVTIEWLADALDVVSRCTDLDWLLVTKRPELWKERCARAMNLISGSEAATAANFALVTWINGWLSGNRVPHNVWMITSTENQEMLERRVPELLKIPAVVHGISAEPLLGPLSFDGPRLEWLSPFKDTDPMLVKTPRIDWVIGGGESGPGARSMNIHWMHDIQHQCISAGVAYFAKQLGANVFKEKWPVCEREFQNFGRVENLKLKDKKGGDMAEWPEEMRVRQWPQVKR